MQGLTVVQGEADFLRYEVHHDGSGLRLFASTTVAGNPQARFNQALPALGQVFLRLERAGDQWTLSWSADAQTWTPAGSFTHAMTAVTAGPFVGNYRPDGAAPAFTARVDYVAGVGEMTPPPGTGDTTPPQISGVSVTPSGYSAVVSWQTDELTTGVVEYGLTDSYGTTSPTTPLGTGHAVTLTGLTPNTTYHYRVVAIDRSDNAATTIGTFHSGDPAGGPTIDLWYGPDLAFGPPSAYPGVGQRCRQREPGRGVGVVDVLVQRRPAASAQRRPRPAAATVARRLQRRHPGGGSAARHQHGDAHRHRP